MAPVVNRMAGLLAWAGVFVAGALTYSHIADKSMPCGPSHGCDTVATSAYSTVLGVPVALIGLIGYLILAGLSAARPVMGKSKWRLLTNLSLGGAVFGFLASIYFVYTSLAVIKATCEWCMASAAIMLVTLIVTIWLWSLEDPEPVATRADAVLQGSSLILVLGAMGGFVKSMDNAAERGMPPIAPGLTLQELLPDKAKMRGNDDAPVTVVEFADFNCPACRSSAKEMSKLFEEGHGRIRWAFRNLPLVNLKGHETSMHAATLSELAAEKGKFWTFFEAAYKPENTERVKSIDGLKQIAVECGLKIDDVVAALQPDSEAAKSVLRDDDLSLKLGVLSTPAYIVVANGVDPRAVSAKRLPDVLHGDPYKNLIWGQ